MNCKQGDVAVILRDAPGCEANVGHLVEVGKPGPDTPEGMPSWWVKSIGSPLLIRDVDLGRIARGTEGYHPDAWLKPIRDTDGEDETLTWAPRKVTA